MNIKYLNYFKDLIEGKEVVTWKVFWKENSKDFEKDLSRTDFLKLKFNKIDFGEQILKENNIPFTWSSKGKQQKVWANLHESVCDENGKPLLSFRRKAFSGAFGAYLDNKYELSTNKIKKHIKNILNEKDQIQRSNLLNDAEFDAEVFLDEGYNEFAFSVLQEISEIETFDDLLIPAIQYAKLRLKKKIKSI
jgi:hypothetical protein